MATHLKIKTTDDNLVHFDQQHNEYTLCGLDIMGDSHLGIEPAVITTEKVNCKQCIDIVEFCKSIKSSEWKKFKGSFHKRIR